MNTLRHASNICTLFAEPSHETAITGPVDLIRDAHRRVTGRELPPREAIHRLHVYGDAMGVGNDVPLSGWKPQVISLLCEATYSPEAIILILGHCELSGTAQCCPHLHIDNMDAVEALLPDQPAEAWANDEYAGEWVTC